MDCKNQVFWNTIGAQKKFSDPFHVDRFVSDLNQDSLIVEYGCGYGRILNLLHQKGYSNSIGFDFAPNMIARGKTQFPELDLRVLGKPLELPLQEACVDAVILSTVMTCIPNSKDLICLMKEMQRVLKPAGVLYISDFLITENEKYLPLYRRDLEKFGEYGVFVTSEGGNVRHFSKDWISNLIGFFELAWYEEAPFVTMNANPINTFHLMANKKV